MLIVGAGGLAAQIFDDLVSSKINNTVFWSEQDTQYPFIKNKFDIIRTDEAIANYFSTVSRSFILCVGNIENRKRLAQKFEQLGGEITSFISPASYISSYTVPGEGTIVLARADIEPGVIIGEKCLINRYVRIGHGCNIGPFCEISPAVILTGEVILGEDTYIGTGAIILPKVKIGKNVTIAAGAIVKKNIPDNAVVSGEFARTKFYKKT
jgi:sugar O-acyltransferase (sialic acid O-acetyltransferase NeuD family)